VIAVIYGTTGELIKLSPVLRRLRDRGDDWLNVTTAQQVLQLPPLLDRLGLKQPDVWLAHGRHGRDLSANKDIPYWLAGVARGLLRARSRLGEAQMVLVHGDTMTTVVGALAGRFLRRPVAHIEAGVRTWDVRHPFPEELNRRAVSAIAQVHYAPGAAAAANLSRGVVVDTGANTIVDAVRESPRMLDLTPPVASPFGLVSLHRYELLSDRRLLAASLELLARFAEERMPLLHVDHPVTVAAIERHGLEGMFGDRFLRIPRAAFFDFVELLRRSELFVTDSGGGQLESWGLDVPCLVHRKAVEQPAGVGENVVVSGLDLAVLERFLEAPEIYRRVGPLPVISPSDVIVADLVDRRFL
jgi:UDP-N-acetylglucosamine 2-epimerase (non-hydrolysing)